MKKSDERYSRQLVMPELGPAAQKKLQKSSVLVLGAGGLGSPVIAYLAAAGVGKLIITEKDKVELSNLNRQVLYKNSDTGVSKAVLAAKFARALNPLVKTEIFAGRAGYSDLLKLSKKADLVVDCADNFETRFNLNRACFENGRICVFAAVYRFEGHVAVLNPRKGACLKCLCSASEGGYRDTAGGGILGAVAGAAGAIAACEAIKTLCGLENLENRMQVFDFHRNSSFLVNLKKNARCSVCSSRFRK